jgi:YD repeat-containing protein
MNSLYDVGGSDIGYSKVSEIRPDGAKSVYKFTNFDDRPDEAPNVYYEWESSYLDGYIKKFKIVKVAKKSNAFPFSDLTYRGWERGLLKDISHFDSKGNLAMRVVNNYDFDVAEKKRITAMKIDKNLEDRLEIAEYDLISKPVYLKSSITYQPATNEPLDLLVNSTFYEYEEDHNQMKSQRSTDSDGSIFETTYTYPFDFELFITPVDDPITKSVKWFIDNHVNSIPLEVRQYKSGKIVGSALSIFKNFNGNPLQVYLYKSLALEINKPLLQTEFVPFKVGFGEPAVFDIHYNTDVPIVENIAYDEVGNILNSVENGLITTSFQYNYYKNLLTSKTTNGITKSYTHIPLIGISLVTEDNGFSTTYEYDAFGRLQWVIDHKGHRVKKYEYSFVNP